MGMIKNIEKGVVKFLFTLRRSFGENNRELITASCVVFCILLLRSFGLLQSLEWTALDQFFQLRPQEDLSEQIVIVTIDEASLRHIGSWPIPDGIIAQLLQKIQKNQPRAIGLDVYRDLEVSPGHKQLVDAYKSMPNLVGIQLLENNNNTRVPPPLILNQLHQVGFNNLLFDADGKVRRSLLYSYVDHQTHESFALKLALLYLHSQGILPKNANNNSEYFQLGKAIFHRFHANDGGYVGADSRGYQIISNFPKPKNLSKKCPFQKVSIRDVLAGQVPESLIRNRIVLIGSTAASLKDFVLMPYSSRLIGTVKPVAGIELQAYFVSELISAALTGRPLIKIWSESQEWLWILLWSYLGATLRWRIQNLRTSFLSILLFCFVLILSAYISFLYGWWIPIVPALLGFSFSAIVITSQIARIQEELKRSKEFLTQVINAIPDPVFVKNKKHQWIVLNEAYCRFIGYSQAVLLENSDYDFFPKHLADAFRRRDELVFENHKPQEHEEEFTDSVGKIHLIATKRSLHKDAAGNLFLVGVIRDITALKQQEDRLRYLAYHDALTGLPNRKFFMEQFEESIQWSQRHNLLLALLFIDLDGFKQVNDTFGHEMGDRVLVIVAQRLSKSLRSTDTICRLGGDEFTVILRSIPHVSIANKVAEQILLTITQPIFLDGQAARVSASIGISIYPIHSNDSYTLVKQADAAMYRAKRLGKNCSCSA